MALGICINANGAVPAAAECAALGLGSGDWVRTAVQGSLTLLDGMLANVPANVSTMITLNNECDEVKSDWSGWERACQIIAAKYAGRVQVVGCANELDLHYYNGDPSVSSLFAANLVRRASPILRAVGIKVAMSSVASGNWPDYLREMVQLCWYQADYADLHLYAKSLNGVPAGVNWQTAQAAILQARTISGLPVICSEAGIKVGDAGGLQQQADWATGLSSLPAELVCAWCWHDRMASPGEIGGQAFGSRGLDGERKPLWFALQNLFGGPANRPPVERHAEFILGFGKWAALESALLGSPLANERNVAPGWQTQPTENGVLSWVENKGHSFVTREGRVFRWDESWPASREVPE